MRNSPMMLPYHLTSSSELPNSSQESSSALRRGALSRRIFGSPTRHLAIFVAAAALSGCAGANDEPSGTFDVPAIDTSSSRPMIFGGAKDDDAQSLAGVVALRVGKDGNYELCSGALIAPNLVLTARHCITQNVSTSVSCDENGNSANGDHVIREEPPENVAIYLGASPTFSSPPAATGSSIITPGGKVLCNADIALVVLDQAITDVPVLPVRLAPGAYAAETIRSIGYGKSGESDALGTRFRKTGVPVLAHGRTISASRTPLGAREFEVGQSICQGDSGGPAISERTGAIIGVVSRGGKCEDDFGHIYTTTAGFDALFDQGFEIAGASPKLETGSPPPIRPAGTSDGRAVGEEAAGGASCAIARGPAQTHTHTAGLLAVLGVAAFFARRRGSSSDD